MSIQDRFAIVRSIASFHQVWTSVVFTRYGSLYCSRDLEDVESSQPLYMYANGGHITKKSFAIGPSVARETFYNRRAAVDFDRGSCNDPLETYYRAIGQLEKACVSQFSELPKSPITLCGLGTLSFQAKEIQTTYSIFQKKEKISKADAEGAIRGMEAMSSIRESLGDFFPEKGIVKQDNYEEALDALSEMKDRKISKFASNAKEREAWEKEWPFGNLKKNSEVV
ncbi:hypothetical protein J3E72DRAFT_396922 [Bipolaris maydis]|nr:hypothetical protein J3E72DRAFT_396922 [Bipolaris maydis]